MDEGNLREVHIEPCPILKVPDEILLKILLYSHLNIEDIFNFAKVCKRFRRVRETQTLWRLKFSERWPWIWNQIKRRDLGCIEDWRENIISLQLFHLKLRKYHVKSSEKLYNYDHITAPVLNSILKSFPSKNFGYIYFYDELLRTIASANYLGKPAYVSDVTRIEVENPVLVCPVTNHNPRPNWQRVLPTFNASGALTPIKLPVIQNMTECYYAKKLIQFAHIGICKEEMEIYLSSTSNQQTLESGATIIEKWMDCNLDLSVDSVSHQIDMLSHECLLHLQCMHPDHPALKVPLRKSDELLSDTLWTALDSNKILRSINYILYEKYNFEGNFQNYYSKENSFISKVLATKKGIPITLCIIYSAVCLRLGLHLQPVNFPKHFVLRWKIPGTNEYEFIDAFGKGKKLKKLELLHFANLKEDEVETDIPATPSEVLQRMANNISYICRDSGKLEDVWFVMELLYMLTPETEEEHTLFYGLFGSYARLEIHYDKIVEGCSEHLKRYPDSLIKRDWSGMKTEFERLLALQQEPPPPVIPKTRTSNVKVKFSTGMVMKHKLYNYICVIYGWDPVCAMSENWMIRMNVYSLANSKNQPFYNVLVADGSNRYAAEENLIHIEPTLVSHPEVGKHFESFNGVFYVPNEQLRKRYPDEDAVRRPFYSNYAL